jgi:MerR family copper efflux transcriptional regulator
MRPLTIGQVARRAGVGIETVRFYERQGLLAEPARKESGYRQYTEDVVARLRFIRRAKQLGFSLKEIAELLALRVEPHTTCAGVREPVEAKIADIESKIQTLRAMKAALVKLTKQCSGTGPTSKCPILDALGKVEGDRGGSPVITIGVVTRWRWPHSASGLVPPGATDGSNLRVREVSGCGACPGANAVFGGVRHA